VRRGEDPVFLIEPEKLVRMADVGLELSDLKYIPKVVGVAGGVHKTPAILGALRGGFLDVLVTNELAAIRLVELQRRARRTASRAH
jgi:lsr operon transcriptional repressor